MLIKGHLGLGCNSVCMKRCSFLGFKYQRQCQGAFCSSEYLTSASLFSSLVVYFYISWWLLKFLMGEEVLCHFVHRLRRRKIYCMYVWIKYTFRVCTRSRSNLSNLYSVTQCAPRVTTTSFTPLKLNFSYKITLSYLHT